MPRYSAYVSVDIGPGHNQEIDELIEAPDPRAAAQRAIEIARLHPDEQFPVILVVEEEDVSIFSRDDEGRAVTPGEDWPRLVAKGPQTIHVQGDDEMSAIQPISAD